MPPLLRGATRPLEPVPVDGRPVPVTLRVSGKAQRLRITVRAEGVEVVLPADARLREAEQFLAQSTRWIESRVRKMRDALQAHPATTRLGHGAAIQLRGQKVALDVVQGGACTGRLEPREGRIRIALPHRIEADETVVEDVLTRWLKRTALADARAMVDRLGPPNGLVPKVVRVKEQATRWGSCSSRGAVNLNWRLITAPPPVFEYVVVHELCHLEHPHHQPPFWRRVAELMPDYGRHRRWLKEHGQRLVLRPPKVA